MTQRHDIEDFISALNIKIIDRNYAVLQKFKWNSSPHVYLTTVTRYFFQDYRDKIWGKWRPSAAAKREGTAAIQLEKLMTRDGYTLQQACQLMGQSAQLTESECLQLYERLPIKRTRPSEENYRMDLLAEQGKNAETALLRKEAQQREANRQKLLDKIISKLPSEERLMLKWALQEDIPVSIIARRLGHDQKKLYRHIKKVQAVVKLEFEHEKKAKN